MKTTLVSKSLLHALAGGRMLLLAACLALLSCATARAAVQIWDADTSTPGPQDGSGNWFTSASGSTTNWWNGTADNSGTWSGSTPDSAIIGTGSGTAGTYVINLDQVVSANSIVFTNPGSYSLTNAVDALTFTGSGNIIYVTTGVNATIASPIKQGGQTILEASNAVLTLTGGSGSTWGGNPIFQGTNQNSSVLNIAGGTYTIGGGTLRFDSEVANITNATVTGPNRLDVGRNFAGTLDLWNGGQMITDPSGNNNSGNNINISRGNPAIINLYPGSLLSSGGNNTAPAGAVFFCHDSASQATLNMYGGTLNVGNGSTGVPGMTGGTLQPIYLLTGSPTYGANNFALFSMYGGITTASSMQFGTGGAYNNNPTNRFFMSGGALYLDVGNISQAKSTGTNFGITVSGGIIGATANWSPACSVPMTLGTTNGAVTFQAADSAGDPFNMAVSGALTGPGGLTKTGGGTLTLSGANSFSGAIVVSNGMLTVNTINAPTNGTVTYDGTAGGTPNGSVVVANSGQHWSVAGLTYAAGTPTADFSYGAFPPSTTVAPVQVAGSVAFTVSPTVTVEGAAIAVGTYPLITYTGTLSGTPPSNLLLTNYATGYLTNLTASKTIALVVTSSTYNPALYWRVGSGTWDTVTPNWTQFGSAVDYSDGKAVVFDDSASGPSPITVTLNQTVNPLTVVVNGSADNYTITGNGSIAGGITLTKDGPGTLTLNGTNTYSGGTIVNNGQLNINYGGDGTGLNSAVGSGPLTLNLGSKIDNTSGAPLTLSPLSQNWNDDFTFVGSASLDLGTGPVTLGSGNVQVTVNTNTLEEDGSITDNGNNYILTKVGPGSLTLSNYNSFAGGMTLAAGQLNINQDGAIGNGKFTIGGGTLLDNTSGNAVTLNEGNLMAWNGSFTFLGSTNLDLGGSSMSIAAITVTVSNNVLATEATISGANQTITKTGPGGLSLGGPLSNGGLGLVVNQGTIYFNKGGGANAFASQLMTVNTNGNLVMESPTETQFGPAVTVTFNGGSLDLNGDSETISTLTFNSGLIQNSSPYTVSTLTSTNLTLGGASCLFAVTSNSTLEVQADLTGTGGLVENALGIVELLNTNLYAGATVVEAGTLLLSEPAEITNSVAINIAAGATVDATYRGDQTLTLGGVQTLSGSGAINGNLVTLPGSTVIPGSASTVGTLTVTNNVTLGGNLELTLNRTNAPMSSQLVSLGTITYGGTLMVTNVGPVLHVGDVFQLFPAGVSAFTAVNLATTDANGYIYTWNNNVAANGTVSVASVVAARNPNPPVIQQLLTGNVLSLAWPTNLGWTLQAQTNSLATGLGTNWVTVPGSTTATNASFTINPANPSVFFRMINQ